MLDESDTSSMNQTTGNELPMFKAGNQEDDSALSHLVNNEDSVLSRWGVRSSSLNDIIRYMIYLRFKLEIINKVCGEITELYGLDKQIAYKVFKETEDEFTIRGYLDEIELAKMEESFFQKKKDDDFKMENVKDLKKLDTLTEIDKQTSEYLERDIDLERLLKNE